MIYFLLIFSFLPRFYDILSIPSLTHVLLVRVICNMLALSIPSLTRVLLVRVICNMLVLSPS
ncbi:hypothetical protein Lalb_Chr20g0109821 [Lupinus albus]|uniref:Uncharacterized protein n=1 Tax=Lupinus albus TaxID=3870 RepID=A0A6A4NMV4_LUPAL|nr:hypothetical protein Lalb_Chr20g0109821 [Lupinus albus]